MIHMSCYNIVLWNETNKGMKYMNGILSIVKGVAIYREKNQRQRKKESERKNRRERERERVT